MVCCLHININQELGFQCVGNILDLCEVHFIVKLKWVQVALTVVAISFHAPILLSSFPIWYKCNSLQTCSHYHILSVLLFIGRSWVITVLNWCIAMEANCIHLFKNLYSTKFWRQVFHISVMLTSWSCRSW